MKDRLTNKKCRSVFFFQYNNPHYEQVSISAQKKEIEFSELEYAILRYEAAFIAQQYTRHKSTTIPYLPPKMSYKRLIYFLVEQRHEWYKLHKERAPLERALRDFGIDSRQTYYNWYEKWHSDYLKLKERHHI